MTIITDNSTLLTIMEIPGSVLTLFGPMFLTLIIPSVLLFLNKQTILDYRKQPIWYRLFYAYLILIAGLSVHIIFLSIVIAFLSIIFNNLGLLDAYYSIRNSNSEEMYRMLIGAQIYLGACGFVAMFPSWKILLRRIANILSGDKTIWDEIILIIPSIFVGVVFFMIANSL